MRTIMIIIIIIITIFIIIIIIMIIVIITVTIIIINIIIIIIILISQPGASQPEIWLMHKQPWRLWHLLPVQTFHRIKFKLLPRALVGDVAKWQ